MERKDMVGYDDETSAGAIHDDIQAADDRTLRLATPYFSREQLEQFVAYQRALKSRLEATPLHAEQWSGHLAAAHASALEVSKLNAAVQSRIAAVVAKFCAHVATRRALSDKQRALRQRLAAIESAGSVPKRDERELDQRISTELRRLESLNSLERRYGKEAIALLVEREDVLLELHIDITKRMSGR